MKQNVLSAAAIFLFISIFQLARGQENVGIGTSSPDASAQLDVSATMKGVLIPRMNTSRMNDIPLPAEGLIIYNTDSGSIFYYRGGWKEMGLKNDNLWTKSGNDIFKNNSGNVGMGTSSPHASAQLDIQSSTKGLLIPRMTTAQMQAIVSPARGLIVYDSVVQRFYFFDNGFWNSFPINNDITWSRNGNHTYRTNTGSVGIGISNPASLLHVFRGTGAGGVLPLNSTATFENSNDTWLSILSPNDKATGIILGTNSNNFGGGVFFNEAYNPKGLAFRAKNGTTYMVIDSFGSVGISHLDPASPLHVRSAPGSSAGGVLPFTSTVGTFESNLNTYVSILTPNSRESGVIFGINSNNASGGIYYNNTTTPKGIQFRTQNNINQMVIDSLGNVGIGDITPDARLKVSSSSQNAMNVNGAGAGIFGGGMYIGLYEADVYRGYLGSWSGAASDVDFGTGGSNTTGKVNLTIQAVPKFSIAADGTAQVLGSNLFEMGAGLAGKEVNAGKIGYNGFGRNALTFVGAGTNNTNRAFYFYGEGGSGFGGNIFLENPTSGARRVDIKQSETGSDGSEILLYNAAGAVTIELDADFGDGDGRVITRELQITGGSDLAEHFSMNNANEKPLPGMLVSIDEKNEGKLIITNCANDKRIAGVISGANGIKAGMLMSQKGTLADGEYPVALAGRVYVLANNEGGEIEPGDLITSSSKKGYAMKASAGNTTGTIIGKAMGKRDPKTGYVLVLVNLQ